MTDLDDAKPGKEQASPATPSPADHVRSRSFLCACLVASIWTIVLLVFIAVKASVAIATFGTIVTAITAIIGIFPHRRPKITKADDTSITTKESLIGKSYCTTAESTGELVPIPNAKLTARPSTTRDCVELLRDRNTDAVFTDALVLYGCTHANPGEFKVVLSGVFGQLQYYGVGLRVNHHEDCLKLNAVISDYLRTRWRQDFQAQLPDAVAAYPGSNASGGDFESRFRPKGSDQTTLSCKL